MKILCNFACKRGIMRHQEELTIQTLTQNEDLKVGYSDNDIVIVDSIQTYTE